ncbi:MAG: ABC transporter permease [Treponema sp.]|jgi:ribose/xylose/arabinose/galactoside ABC-type transport system permease subunit|nr:ABC transporter permease [Treponema sp.]
MNLTSVKDGSTEEVREKKLSSQVMLLISIVVLWGIFAVLSKYFLSFKNIMNLLQYSSILGIAACGMTFVIISGSLDISVGSVAAFVAVYSARFVQWTDLWWVGLFGGILLAVFCGCINATMITFVRINPLITTLGTMTIFRGIAHLENNSKSVPVTNEMFKQFGQGYFFGIPIIVLIMVAVFVLWGFVFKYTRFGREVYSVGGNAQASFLSGISVKRTRFFIYVIASLMAGFAGVCNASLVGAGPPNAGTELALEAISSVILGGAALAGGRGTIVGTALGVLVLGTISNGLTLLNVSSFYQMIFKGIILLLAVAIDVFKGEGAYE